jgi:hypothetical protein
VLTTISEVYNRAAMHGVRSALLDRQIAALGLPCTEVPLPSPRPNDVYETRMAHACAQIKSQGIELIVFGDLFLADIRACYVSFRRRSSGRLRVQRTSSPVRRVAVGSRAGHQTPHALDEPFDLVRGGVRSAAGAHQAFAFMTQHPGNSGRVEVAV